MFVSQFRDYRNRIQPSVLGQCRRDDLERLGKGLEAVCFFSFEGLGVLSQKTGDVDLWCTSSCNQGPVIRQYA